MVMCLYYRLCLFLAVFFMFTAPVSAAVPNWVSNLTQHDQIQKVDPAQREEVTCVALAIYFEAGGESVKGQQAVGNVVMNRTKSGRYPDTACGVLLQRGQFAFIKGGRSPTPKANTLWESTIRMATTIVAGSMSDVSNGALSFCQRRLRRNGLTIGGHVFYRP